VLGDEELLTKELAIGIAMRGVTVVRTHAFPVDGRP